MAIFIKASTDINLRGKRKMSTPMLMLPMRCFNGHIVAWADKIEKFMAYQRTDTPRAEILDRLGLSGIKKQCCRSVFMTTVDVEEKFNNV